MDALGSQSVHLIDRDAPEDGEVRNHPYTYAAASQLQRVDAVTKQELRPRCRDNRGEHNW